MPSELSVTPAWKHLEMSLDDLVLQKRRRQRTQMRPPTMPHGVNVKSVSSSASQQVPKQAAVL